jgi:putative flippase GtrA
MDLIKQLIKKMFRYGLVGCINTMVFLAIISILSWLGLNYIVYTAVAYILSFFCSFYLNLRFAFQVDGMFYKRLQRFILLNLTNLLCTEGIQIYLIEVEKIPHAIGIFMGMVFYVIFGFIMNQIIVYRKQIPSHA